jgi:S-formylglutathione hydrolase FrmB
MALLETRFDSDVLDLSLGMSIILPEHPDAWEEPPAVLYLLHGLTDDHTIWHRRTSIERYSQDYNLIVVMPDAYKSFYCNMTHGSSYWTFCAEELPILIKRWFNISNDWKNTFVAGLSMGGYGAVKLAMECPGQYGAAASLSGALDLASHINDDFYEHRVRTFEAVFGDIQSLPNSNHDLIAQLSKMKKVPETEFFVCVGTEDYLYQDSVSFRDKARTAGLRLTYEELPGEHKWDFWDRTIQHVLEWLPIEKLPPVDD